MNTRSMRRVRRSVAGAVLLAAVLLAAGCGDDDPSALAGIELPALGDDTTLDLGSVDGPAVLNVWATWCQPCVRELPAFEQASAEHPAVRFIGIDATGSDDDDASVAYLAELGVTYEQYVDPDGELTEELRITELPATVIIDTAGDIVVTHQGELTFDELTDHLAAL